MSYIKGSQLPATSTVADTDTLIVTQEGDSKATKKVAKSDLLKEDRTRLTNLETDNTTNKNNITNLQKSLENKAEKNHNHDSVYVKQDGSTPITGRQQLKMGSYVFEAHAGNGTEGYALVAEFKILRNYQNTPIKIELARRGVLYSNITIQFRNTDSLDPTLQNFVYEGSDCMAYMVKADTSTWNLYIRKTEGYDVIFITKYSNPNSAITTTWKESVVTSLPDGGTYATPLQHAISEITDLQTTLDSKMSKIYDNKIIGAISLDFKKQIVGTASNGGFVNSFRKDDSTDDCMPKYGAGLAWGQVDTHGMLCVDYNNPTAYVAGGNSNKLNWSKQIAWKDDLITILFERNNGTINKNINTCFNSSSGNFTAPEAGQYLIMCSGYELSSSSSEYVACVLDSSSSNQNKLYTTGSSGFTLITLNEGQTLAIYTATAGNMNKTCISSNSAVNMLIARIN